MVGSGRKSEKTIHHQFDPSDDSVTLETVLNMIENLRKKHPDREVFFDGDEYSICSRPKHGKHGAHRRS
ncbi:MAG: hypothetical protein JRN35_11070 [Nitrososphaerota archaeon]|nr:hypothetical protein [Nitrososphaerota archaeon]